MTSRERLQAVFAGKPVDRVPVSLYEFHGYYDAWIFDYPEYVAILDYAKGRTDRMQYWRPTSPEPSFLLSVVDPGTVEAKHWRENGSIYTRTLVHTPRGDLSMLQRRDEGVHTSWKLEHLCKTPEDAERIMSLPTRPYLPPVGSFFELDAELGDDGIVLGDVSDALSLSVDLFGFSTYLLLFVERSDIVFRLLDFLQARLLTYLEHLLAGGAVTVYRITGPEYATVPYMSPSAFERLVVSYDRAIIDLLHRYGATARLHSHGRIRDALPSFKSMQIDATDPLEPPPDGDVTPSEIRRVLGDEVVLIGNIEERLFEIGTKDEIETAVKTIIDELDGRGLILCPTAMPLTTPLAPAICENIVHYIDCGERYGSM